MRLRIPLIFNALIGRGQLPIETPGFLIGRHQPPIESRKFWIGKGNRATFRLRSTTGIFVIPKTRALSGAEGPDLEHLNA